MKILQVSPAYYPALSIGGPILSSFALTRLLCKRHRVDTLTTPLGLSDDQKRALVLRTPVPSACGSRLIYQPYHGYDNLTFSPASLWWLQHHAAEYDLVILQGVWNFPLMAAALICRWRRIPYLLFPHGTLYAETIALKSSRSKRLLLRLFVSGMLENATRILFTTDDEAKKVSAHLRLDLKPFVVPNIVEAAEFDRLPPAGSFRLRHGIPASTRVLLHYGRLTRKKGIESAIRALAALRAQGREVVLAVVGPDSEGYRPRLDTLAAELKVTDAVIFTGLLDRDRGKEALVDADIFVLPSLSENFGIAVVEAMLCRLPVVVSDQVGLAPDLARAGVGVVVPLAEDANPLARALGELLDDESQRRNLGEKGRTYAIENYDTPAVEARIDELLRIARPS